MKSKTFEIPTIGKIDVCKHHNAKRISLKMTQGKNPRVIIPTLMPYKMGLSFAIEKKEWITETKKKIEKQNNGAGKFKPNTLFKTRYFNIYIKQTGTKVQANKKNNEIILHIPESKDFESENTQNIIKDFITEVLRGEAKKHLIPRTKKLAQHFGFKINNIYIKNLKSRWGSCSAVNNINLNLHLMRLPEHLSDFVILHELCHTVHKNHGSEFHKLLDTISGNEKTLDKELRNYRIEF